MSQSFHHLRGHLAVIATQCDMLEDFFSARPEIMTRIKVIRNAAYRIAGEMKTAPWPLSARFGEDQLANGSGGDVDLA